MWHWLVFAFVAGAATSAPQQQSPVPNDAVYDEEIVVTASLEQEPAAELPVAVAVIDREEIRQRQATEIFELLRTVPGLDVTQSGSPGSVVSVFSRGAESNQTLVLWNGIPLNDPYFGGFDFASLPTDGVRRIEVARGPFSALYGSQSMGGVVQVLTGGLTGGVVRLEGGEDDYSRLGAAWGEDLGTLRIDLAAHLRSGEGAARNDYYDSRELLASLEWGLGERASVGLLARAASAEIGIPTASGAPTPRRRQESDSVQFAVPVEVEIGRWRVQAAASYVASDLLFTDEEAFFSRSDTEAERLRGRSVATYGASDRLRVSVGADWQRDEVSSRTNFGVDLDSESRRGYGLFAELYKAVGPLRFDLGVRRDEDEFFGTAVSPRLGVLAVVGRRTRLFASYGEGFRAPSLGELFFPFFGNAELAAEESENLEAGVRFEGRRWSLGATWFSSDFSNLIDTDPLTFTAVNVGRAQSRGVEADVGYRRGVVEVRLAATRLDTEDLATGQELLRRPRQRAHVVIAVRPGRWMAEAVVRYVGDRPDLDPVTFGRAVNEKYFVGDLAVTWDAVGRWSPYARLRNVTDEIYEEVLGFAAPGRTATVGLEVELP